MKMRFPEFSKQTAIRVFFLVVGTVYLVPASVSAQSLLLQAARSQYALGDSFSVSLTLDTKGRAINTVSGKITVPPEFLQIVDVRSGNSVVTLWVERPTFNAGTGVISFTGGIPGGFNGSAGPILSFGVKAKKAGSAVIRFDSVRLLLNDGQGTEVPDVSFSPFSLTIAPAPAKAPAGAPKAPPPSAPIEYQPAPDTVPPEEFMPLVSRHPTVADNKYFVSFFAVDKDSGIDHYEIQERLAFLPFLRPSSWTQSESPFVLAHQWWRTTVTVRAYDQAGNITDGYAVKEFDPLFIALASGALGLLLAVLVIAGFYWRFIYPIRKKQMRTGRGIR